MADFAERLAQRKVHAPLCAFVQQQGHDLPGRAVAEQLAQGFFMPGDPVAVDQVDEVLRAVAAECALCEMGVGGNVTLGGCAHIGEVAPAAPRNQDLPADFGGMVDHQHPRAPLAGNRRAHQPGPAPAQHDRIIVCRPRHPAPIAA
jgi:hypothetical protein